MRIGLALVWLLGCALGASAQDIVEMKDGRIVRGTVLEQDDQTLTIRAQVGPVESVVIYRQDDIRSVTITEVEEEIESPAEEPPLATELAALPPEPELPDPPIEGEGYLVVPFKGTFGREIQAGDFKRVLERAQRQQGVKHIVLDLDSPGGALESAREISELMLEHSKHFRFHTLVTQGLSASIWVVFASDTVIMRPLATLGAAVPYLRVDSGAQQVDAKMMSALIASLRASAERKGLPPELVNPMVQMGTPLVAWRNTHGEVDFGPHAPAGVDARDVLLRVGYREILTLTASQAEAVGLARAAECDAAGLGARLQLTPWVSAGDYGATEMARGLAELEALTARLDQMARDFAQEAVDAEKAFKASLEGETFYYNPRSGRLSRGSLIKWKTALQAAVDQCDQAGERLDEIRELRQELAEKKSPFRIDEEALENAEAVLDGARRALAIMSRWADISQIGPFIKDTARVKARD